VRTRLENESVDVRGSVDIDWMYPDAYEDNPKDKIEIHLYSVRAADSLIIKYDMERDGWSISMARTKDHDDYSEDTGIVDEMAFIPAWNTGPDTDAR
jgi:hypothetical protein